MSKIKNGALDQYGKVKSLNGIGGEKVNQQRMRPANAFGRICLSVCPVRVLTFESIDLETSFLTSRCPSECLGESEYYGHTVKIKDIRMYYVAMHSYSWVVCNRLRSILVFKPFHYIQKNSVRSEGPLMGLLPHNFCNPIKT